MDIVVINNSKWTLHKTPFCFFLHYLFRLPPPKKNGKLFTSLNIYNSENRIAKCFNKEMSVKECKDLTEIKETLLNKNLKKYNIFNIYLDKIRKTEIQRKNITNLHHVKYYNEYIHLFNLEALLKYANHKLKMWKRKTYNKHNENDINFRHFFNIFIQYCVILNDFLSSKNGKKCQIFQNTFQKYRKEINDNQKVQTKYNQVFFVKIVQIIKIFNQTNFFDQLEKEDLVSLSLPNEKKMTLSKNKQQQDNEENDEILLYKYMGTNEQESIDINSGSSFLHSLKLFNNISEIEYNDTYFYMGNKSKDTSYVNHQKKDCENKQSKAVLEKNSCEDYEENKKEYFKLLNGFFFLLKSFVKHLNDDTTVKLFMASFKMLKDAHKKKEKEVQLFYKEIYKKLKTMKNISNKNIAYILTACNNIFCEPNHILLDHIKEEILKKEKEQYNSITWRSKQNKGNQIDIYKITPSHLENVIFTFAKNKYKDKQLFLLFSRIIKKKYEGFSCIVIINILHSFAVLNYEMLIFTLLYEQIKSFDILTFVTCTSKNILKLINTLLLIEDNFQKKKTQNKMKQKKMEYRNINTITEYTVYTTLFMAILYEQKRFKNKNMNEETILNLYKKCIRLHIVKIMTKTDLQILKKILKKNYEPFCVAQLDRTINFSFLNKNIDKICLHKLIWALMGYSTYVQTKKNVLKEVQWKRKFL